ncbi:MAG: hypothetical protein FWF05_03125 [Oscillospiraceae bacterium]|nr:hypothetical protein [Oscillospiraceae bacterium]
MQERQCLRHPPRQAEYSNPKHSFISNPNNSNTFHQRLADNTTPYFFAADLNKDGVIDTDDLTIITDVVAGLTTIDQRTGMPPIPELIPMANSTTIIDHDRKFIYGLKLVVTESELRTIFLDVEGPRSFVVQQGTLGTGATVKLYSNYDSTFEEVYKLVIFGDVNGDGLVNANDVSEISEAEFFGPE